MKRNLVFFGSVLVIFAFLLSACGGSAPAAATEAPGEAAEATEAPAQVNEAPAATTSTFYLEIADFKGTVEVSANANEDYAPAEIGQRLHEGAQIRTGADGVVILYRDLFSMLILDFDTEVQIKTLQGTPEAPVTRLLLVNGAAFIQRLTEGEIPAGFEFAVEAPDGNTGGIFGSPVAAINNGPKVSAIFKRGAFDRAEAGKPSIRASYNPETKLTTVGCVVGPCTFKQGEQTVTLNQGQEMDVKGLGPLPQPVEMSVEQANQVVAMTNQACGCQLTIEAIRDGELAEKVPAPDDVKEEQKPEDNSGSGGDNSGSGSDNSGSGSDNSGSDNSGSDNSGGGGDDNSGGGGDSSP